MKDKALEDKITSLRSVIAWMDLVMANVNESILVLDTDWRIVFANSYLAEVLAADRIMLLGKVFWDVLPQVKQHNGASTELPLKSIAKLNGVYEFKYKSITRKLSLRGQYVPALNQAVCIISDVSVELQAKTALLNLRQEVAQLKKQVARLKSG